MATLIGTPVLSHVYQLSRFSLRIRSLLFVFSVRSYVKCLICLFYTGLNSTEGCFNKITLNNEWIKPCLRCCTLRGLCAHNPKTCGLNSKSNLVLDGRKRVTVFWFSLAVWKFSSLLELMLFSGTQIKVFII